MSDEPRPKRKLSELIKPDAPQERCRRCRTEPSTHNATLTIRERVAPSSGSRGCGKTVATVRAPLCESCATDVVEAVMKAGLT